MERTLVLTHTEADGLLGKLSMLPKLHKRFTLCDIDPRALSVAREIHGDALAGTDTLTPGAPLPYPSAHFDAVVSMDVIEHLVDPLPWLSDALRVLKPGGLLFLTTPNYASHSLRAIENTALEAIARAQGFSRKDLHPSKLDTPTLSSLLARAGSKNAVIKQISFGWVLAAFAWR